MINFLKILEENFQYKKNNRKLSMLEIHAKFLGTRIIKKIGSIKPRHNQIYSFLLNELDPYKIEDIYKKRIKNKQDLKLFLNVISEKVFGHFNIKMPKDYVYMIVNKYPVSEYIHSEDEYGDVYMQRSIEEQTEYQKYISKHKNGHEQSLNRTVGKEQEKRKHQNFVPFVKTNKKNPYVSDVVNKAEKSSRILTQSDMMDISLKYNIDFNDRHEKTIKGKTGMILTPLPNGSWKLHHK
jgi:hypothetical protein